MKKIIIACLLFTFLNVVAHGQVNENSLGGYYDKALSCMDNNDYNTAYNYLLEQNKLTPNNGNVLVNLAYCELIANNEAKEALSTVNKAFKYTANDNKELLANCYATRGAIYMDMNEIDSSINDFTEALKLVPSYPFAIESRGYAYLNNKKFDKALTDFEALKKYEALNGYIGKAQSYGNQGKWDETINELNNYLKLESGTPSHYIYELRSAAYIEKKMYSEAIDDLITSLELGDSNLSNLYGIAVLIPEWKDYIISKLRIMSNKNPDSADWLIYLGNIYRVSSDFKNALKCYKEADDKGLGVDLNERISDCLSALGDYIKAYKYIEKAAYSNPNDYKIELKRAEVLFLMGKPLDAISSMDKVVLLEPENYYAYHQRGWYKELYGDLEGALEDYNIAIILNPKHAYTYFNRGRIREKQGDLERARKDYEMVLSIDTIAQASSVSQYAFLHLGNVDKAKEWMNQVLDSDRSAGNYYDAACLYSLMDEKDIAISYLRKALESGFRRFFHISIDHDLDNIRNVGAYKSLIKEYETILKKDLNEYDTFD